VWEHWNKRREDWHVIVEAIMRSWQFYTDAYVLSNGLSEGELHSALSNFSLSY